jgi:hypothetical protein
VVQGAVDQSAQWRSQTELYRHFQKHRWKLGVKTASAYDVSARATIRAGKRFEYEDDTTLLRRVGYFEEQTLRFTALTLDEKIILSHYRTDDRNYPRRRRGSTY